MIKINLFPEKWKVIPGFPDYAISNSGKIIRLAKGRGSYPGRMLKGSKGTGGYLYVCLHFNHKPYVRRVHQLVALAFLGTRPEKKEVNHKNGIKIDNTLENLEYVTKSENKKHAFKLGLETNVGENNPTAKLNLAKISKIFALHKSGLYQREIANIFNVSQQTISAILTGYRWKGAK